MFKKTLSLSFVFIMLFPISVKADFHSFNKPKQYNSFESILKNPSLVSYWAWRKSRKEILSSHTPTIQLNIFDSNNVIVTNQNPLHSLDLTYRLYHKSNPPTVVNILRYHHSDISWAESIWQKAFPELPLFYKAVSNACNTNNTCYGGFPGLDSNNHSWLGLATMQSNLYSPNHTSGTLESHEYLHTIQQSQMIGSEYYFHSLPIWLYEGQASFTQAASLYYSSFNSYMNERNRIISSLNESSEWIKYFLNLSVDWSKNTPTLFNHWRPYDVGFLVTEILVAYKGPISVMNLYKEVASGKTFEQAFYSQYKTTWEKAYPIISKIVYLNSFQ